MGVFFQVLKASLAEATAALISSGVAKGTRASTCCVAGFTTSRHWVVLDSTNWPPISSLTVGAFTAWEVDASMVVSWGPGVVCNEAGTASADLAWAAS